MLHRLYRLQTDKGDYAVKALNPQIMKRETAMSNFIFSEKVANIAYKNGIPALPAIALRGNCVQDVDGQYYLAFEWFNGKTLTSINIENSEKIGGLLAKIHQLDFSEIMIDDKKYASDLQQRWKITFHWRMSEQ